MHLAANSCHQIVDRRGPGGSKAHHEAGLPVRLRLALPTMSWPGW